MEFHFAIHRRTYKVRMHRRRLCTFYVSNGSASLRGGLTCTVNLGLGLAPKLDFSAISSLHLTSFHRSGAIRWWTELFLGTKVKFELTAVEEK